MSGSKVIINTQECVKRFDPRFSRAQKFLDNQVLQDTEPYVPMLSGTLAGSGIRGTVIGSGKVIYNAPYAKKTYYLLGANFNKEQHPLASAQWFEKSKAVKKKAWIDGAEKIVKGE